MPAAVSPVVRTLLFVTLALWLALELRQGLRHRPEATSSDAGSRPVIQLSPGIVGGLLVRRSLPSFSVRPEVLASWIGVIFVWCGIILRFWSFHTLGRYFTLTVQTSADQPVISAGPYRVIRHPSYAGILLIVLGAGFLIGNWVSLVLLTVAASCGLVYRIRVEERALSRDLGGKYQLYAEGRKRLVPFIW
jgi:protein-S-isoprenylcysteine O-methyltransferase Ste14